MIPVTIVTGFLGSGKTTLLAGVLSDPSLRNTAVLVNEFGEVGLDHLLLRRVDEKTVLLGNGCVCCATREDLVETLVGLLDDAGGDGASLDRVIVETTGLADPAPIMYTVFANPVLRHHFAVDRVICTVDAVNGDLHLGRNPESAKQVVAADEVVITKTDLAEPGKPGALRARLRALNPSARVTEAAPGAVDAGNLFRPGEGRWSGTGVAGAAPESPLEASHGGERARSVSLTFDGPVDWVAFGVWLSMLLHARGEDVLRVKGLLDVGERGPVFLNGVQHAIHPPRHLERWPDEDHRPRVVFITRGMDPEELLDSLRAFGTILGAAPRPLGENTRV